MQNEPFNNQNVRNSCIFHIYDMVCLWYLLNWQMLTLWLYVKMCKMDMHMWNIATKINVLYTVHIIFLCTTVFTFPCKTLPNVEICSLPKKLRVLYTIAFSETKPKFSKKVEQNWNLYITFSHITCNIFSVDMVKKTSNQFDQHCSHNDNNFTFWWHWQIYWHNN